MRLPAFVAGIALVILVNAGCVPAPQAAKAQPAGRTLWVIGTAEEEYVRGMVRSFELESGIKTGYVRKSAGEALDVINADRIAPRYSVWWGGSIDGYIQADSLGLLEPYKPKGSNLIPRQYKDADGHWTGVYVGVLAIAVNTRVLQEKGLPEPTRWVDLVDPIYRGEISIAHPATSGTAYTAIATIMQLNGKDVEKAFSFLAELNRNVKEYQRAGAVPPRVAGRGEVAIAIAFAHDIVAAIGDGGTDLKIIYPQEGTGYEIGGMALIKNGPDPDLGREYMDWAMGQKAQELGPLFTAYQIPTNPDARVPEKSVRLNSIKTIPYDFEWAGENRKRLVDRFSATIALPPNEAPAN